MSLLRQIQEDAVDPAVPLNVVLRKCKVLAARLSNEAFEEWVDHELNGYPEDAPLPPYRIGPALALRGNFINSAWQASGIAVPIGALPDAARDELSKPMEFREGIAAIDEIAKRDGAIAFGVPPGLAAHVSLFAQMNCYSLWGELPKNYFVGLLDQVRNRALSFALEIEKENPEAGEQPAGSEPIAQDRVNNIYSTTIFGNVAAVASGASIKQAVTIGFNPGDLEGLLLWLQESGVAAEDTAELKAALIEDEKDRPSGEVGHRTRDWLGRMAVKVATGAGYLALTGGGNLLGLAIARYLGIA